MAVTPYNVSQISAALKIKFQNGLPHLYYPACPFHAYMTKLKNLDGRKSEVAANGQSGIGYTGYTDSYENAMAASPFAFEVTPIRMYVHGFFDAMTLKASKSNDAALESALEMGITSAMEGFERQAEFSLLHSGGGARGQVDSGVTVGSTNLQLRDARTARWFKPGQILQLASDNGVTGSAGVRAGTLTVSTVNYQSGLITTTANINSGITSPTVNDFIFQKGDYQAVHNGLQNWIPLTDAALGTHLGVNQTADPLNRAGSRINVAGTSTEEGIIEGLAIARDLGQKIDCLWLSPRRFADLTKDLESKVLFSPSELKTAEVSIDAVKFRGGYKGSVKVMELPGLEDDYGFACKDGTWQLRSVDDFPHFSEEDGLELKHTLSADQYMFVLAAYGDYVCTQPRHSGWIKWA